MAFILVWLLLFPVFASAETGAEMMARGTPTPALVTCFAPGPNDNVEGPWATSQPRPNGACTDGGGSIPMTLDAVRLGTCKYVTLAANPAYYGRYFYIGTVRYVSPIRGSDGNGREYVLNDVIGYVHDTGPAFREGLCARWNTCANINRKFDVALGDFRGWNGRNASQHVDVTNRAFCGNRSTTFYQIGGAPVNPPRVSAQDVTGNRTIAIVPGDPVGSRNYGPFGLGIQPYTSSLGAFSGQPAMSGYPAGLSTQSPLSVSPTQGSVAVGEGTTIPSNTSSGNYVAGGQSAGALIVQPGERTRGASVLVSWTSVNMQPSSCKVLANGQELSTNPEGSQAYALTSLTTFVLRCTTAKGDPFEDVTSASVQ